jgi:hydroxymethylbilane synthase
MRIGTRRSALALAQARLVADSLDTGLQPASEIVPIVTQGDRGMAVQDKSRWVSELEDALLQGEIDLAVHSAKDVPGELAEGLVLLGAPTRAGAADVLCGADGLDRLAGGARVGTSSIRRAAQLRSAREDLEVIAMRGNVDTRLEKLEQGDFDAIVLAGAGLERLGRSDAVGAVLDPELFVPAPGQGTLALQARADDLSVLEAVQGISDAETLSCLLAERELARELQASCHTPLGAHAVRATGGSLRLRAWLGLPDGSAWIRDELLGGFENPEQLGHDVAARLKLAGAGEMLQRAEEMAPLGSA